MGKLRSVNVGLIATAICGCSSEAVIGAPGSGGATSTTSTSASTSVQPATAVVHPCVELEAKLSDQLAAARACDPTVDSPQCTGNTVVRDCYCEWVANDENKSEAEEAMKTYDALLANNCVQPCCFCPPPPEEPWTCDVALSICYPVM